MFCPNCGTSLPDEARFCPECGQYVDLSAPDYASAAPDPNATRVPAAIPVPDQPVPMPAPQTPNQTAEAPASVYIAGDVVSAAAFAPDSTPAPATPTPEAPAAAAPTAVPPAQGGVNKMRLAIGVAAVALALFIVVRVIVGIGGASSKPSSQSDPVSIEAIPTDGSSSHAAAANFESHGYPTVSALVELSGSELRAALERQGYTYYAQDQTGAWALEDGTIIVNAYRDYDMLGEDDIDSLKAGGAGEPVVYFAVVEGYSSCVAALDGMCGCTIEQQASDSAGDVIALCHDAAGERSYYVVIEDVDDGDLEMTVFNEEAVGEGFLVALTDGVQGTTTNEIIDSFAARS